MVRPSFVLPSTRLNCAKEEALKWRSKYDDINGELQTLKEYLNVIKKKYRRSKRYKHKCKRLARYFMLQAIKMRMHSAYASRQTTLKLPDVSSSLLSTLKRFCVVHPNNKDILCNETIPTVTYKSHAPEKCTLTTNAAETNVTCSHYCHKEIIGDVTTSYNVKTKTLSVKYSQRLRNFYGELQPIAPRKQRPTQSNANVALASIRERVDALCQNL